MNTFFGKLQAVSKILKIQYTYCIIPIYIHQKEVIKHKHRVFCKNIDSSFIHNPKMKIISIRYNRKKEANYYIQNINEPLKHYVEQNKSRTRVYDFI